MKTEGLSWAEAIKAYAAGQEIEVKTGFQYRLVDSVPQIRTDSSCNWRPHRGLALSPDLAPFRIVTPEPRKLTAAEALKLSQFRVKMPSGEHLEFGGFLDGITAPDYTTWHHSSSDGLKSWGWNNQAKMMAHLAEAQGWPIYAVEEG